MFRFRLRNLLLLIAVLAVGVWVSQYLFTTRAHFVIERMTISEDKQWGKNWASIDFRIEEPRHLNGETFNSFIEVDALFVETQKYETGDSLIFRYRYRPFLGLEQQEPRQVLYNRYFRIAGKIPEAQVDGTVIAGPFLDSRDEIR